MIVEAGDWLTGHEANAGKHIKEAAGNTAQIAWKRASRMYDLPTLDWPCPTRIWCICCLLHIKAASTALTSRPSAELLWRWLDGHPFVTRPPKDRDFPPRGVLGKGSVRKSRISLIHVEHAAVFTFFRGITNRQSEQLLRPGFWSSICRESMTFIGTWSSAPVRRVYKVGQLFHTSATVSHKIQNLPPDGRKVIVENGPPHAEKLARSKMIVEAGDWLTGHEANAGKHIKEAAGNTAQFAWKRASRMYDLSTLDWPCPTRIWCICCLSTAYQSSIHSYHMEVIG